MSLDPLFAEGWITTVHALAAIGAFLLGSVQLAAPKGTIPHRTAGYIWVGLMVLVVVTSMFINTIRQLGPLCWIHGLSIITAVGLVFLVVEARRGKVRDHMKTAIFLFVTALVIAGGFTLLPGRTMHNVVFG